MIFKQKLSRSVTNHASCIVWERCAVQTGRMGCGHGMMEVHEQRRPVSRLQEGRFLFMPSF